MKKVLLYGVTAILLGTVTMIAPLMLLEPSYYGPRHATLLSMGKETYDGGEALKRAVSPSNLSATGLLTIPSFLFALGAFLYIKKRML